MVFYMNCAPIAALAPPRRRPDFENLLKILRREAPSRPTLFEIFLNAELYHGLTARLEYPGDPGSSLVNGKRNIDAFALCGYDYASIGLKNFQFRASDPHTRKEKSDARGYSLNETTCIAGWEDFERYEWPDPGVIDTNELEALGRYQPEGMKILIIGPGGIMENSIRLMGYETMCVALHEDPKLVDAVYENVGRLIHDYYKIALQCDGVGALILNDDWGFNTQPMLPPDDMRRLIFPWYAKITAMAHAANKPVVLHSCGKPDLIMRDIIDDVKIDGRHSYEDVIQPVEDFYEAWHEQIAVIGGIDVHFLCTASPAEIRARTAAMIGRTEKRGSWAVGSGNSIPNYVPLENYFAMVQTALNF
jgi:uroporphyrinogen decarboxylase